MEYLTKQQIILLALLVSFVSSIATGVVVISLSDQSAATVPQTISRVVERTIEKVSSDSAPTKETVIVKDDQAVVDAIAQVSKSNVTINMTPIGSYSEQYFAFGLIVSRSGKIVAETSDIPSGAMFVGKLDGGNSVALTFIARDATTGLSVFQADQSTDPRNARVYTPVALADSSGLKLGQSIVVLTYKEAISVATGIISSLQPALAIYPDMPTIGGPSILINLLGEVIAIQGLDSFIPSNIIKTYATP